jgi:ribonuclease BN (tRNA processing enzyme)
MRIRFCGTSSAVPCPGSGFTSLLVEAGGRLGLIDAGDNPARAIQEADADPLDLAFVVLTHRHADHLGAFPALVASLDCLRRRTVLTIIASREPARDARHLLDFFRLAPASLSFPLRYVDGWHEASTQLELLPGSHSVPTSMVRVREGANGFLYTSDCVADPDRVAAGAASCGVLIHEATFPHERLPAGTGHSSALQAGRAAAAAGVARLFLCHLDPVGWSGAGDPAAEAAKAFSGEVTVPEPGVWYPVAT